MKDTAAMTCWRGLKSLIVTLKNSGLPYSMSSSHSFQYWNRSPLQISLTGFTPVVSGWTTWEKLKKSPRPRNWRRNLYIPQSLVYTLLYLSIPLLIASSCLCLSYVCWTANHHISSLTAPHFIRLIPMTPFGGIPRRSLYMVIVTSHIYNIL